MPSLGDIKRRIKSVKNTQQITKAMKMVSAAKLRRAQDEIIAARPYAGKMLEMISRLAAEMFAEAEAKDKAAAEAAAEGTEAGGGDTGGEETPELAPDTPVEDEPEGEDEGAAREGAEAGATELETETPVEPWPEDEVDEAPAPAESYVKRVLGMIPGRATKASEEQHPLLSGTGGPSRPGGPKKGVVLITSDRGLCGSFNSVLLRTMETFLAENEDSEPVLYLMGNRGIEYFKRRGLKVLSSRPVGTKRPEYSTAAEIAGELMDLYLTKEVDEVYIVYSEFVSALTQVTRARRLLPITPAAEEAVDGAAKEEAPPGSGEEAGQPGGRAEAKFLYEPSTWEVLAELLPKHVEVQFFSALLDSSASEHGARMTAMDAASRSASEMIDGLTLKYNRLRQAAITKELMEIISGAESLKS
jgi:F-type H+-transporting ATPase subunit gamma